MFAFRYARLDLQHELVNDARSRGVIFTIDARGFIVVQSDDQHRRLEELQTAIDKRLLVQVWYFGSDSPGPRDQKRTELINRGVPFLEYEWISDRPRPWLEVQQPQYWHYGLAIRSESSLPKGQRPWDRST